MDCFFKTSKSIKVCWFLDYSELFYPMQHIKRKKKRME